MDVKLAAAVLGAVRKGEVSAFCGEHRISRQTFYKWRRRAAAEGRAGLEDRSRRPQSSPTRTAPATEEAIVRIRKELDDFSDDNGPWSIRQRLAKEPNIVSLPSEATIWRILVRRGLIVPEPKKRPKRSLCRFVYPRPNDCWQIDATGWFLADGSPVEIIDIVDDHSRVCVASRAVLVCTTRNAWETFLVAAQRWAFPARVLSDNGLTFNGSRRQQLVQFEANLLAAGIIPITASPYHPQTCGKVERFHQTVKDRLSHQRLAATIEELQAQLDAFIEHYNHHRPHRSLAGATPATTWAAQPAATPANTPITTTRTITRDLTVTTGGNIHLDGHTIGLGVTYAGLTVTAILTTRDCIVFHDNQFIRALEINPDKYHQPTGNPRGGPRKPRLKDS